MRTYSIYLLLSVAMFLVSCEKNENNQSSRPSNFGEAVASPNFNWSTFESVDIEIQATPIPVTIKRTLTIETENGAVVYKGLYQMDENFTAKVEVPAGVKSLNIQYGTIQKTVAIASGKCSFDMSLPAEAYGSF